MKIIDMKLQKVILIISIVNLVACTEPGIRQADIAQTPVEVPCVFQNLKIAPSWICDEPVSGLYIQGIGMAEKSAAGQNYMQDMARIAALKQLAEKLEAIIARRVMQYTSTTGMESTETIDALVSSSVKTITSKALESTKNLKTLIGPEGRVYVVVGLDKNTTKAIVKNMVMTSIISEPALWQEFKTQKSADEMAARIAAMED